MKEKPYIFAPLYGLHNIECINKKIDQVNE